MSDTETRPETIEQDVVERAFLIADVRGYTRFTRAHGDAAAARLAGAFASLARDAVAARGGRVIELRGDEALAVFEAPRQAVRAAVDLVALCAEEVAEHPDLPLLVGVGVDAGPAVPLEGGYRGAAINTAARLCSQAAAGQVLVPAALMDAAGPLPDVRASAHGALELKGFETPLDVVEVRSARERPAERPRLPEPEPLPVELEVGTPLIGRDDEMCWLRGCWRQARRGDGRLLVLSGEEGIGRTRLTAELAAVVQGEGLVRYAGAGGTALAAAEAELRAAAAAELPMLVVLDDVDVTADRVVPAIEQVLPEIDRRPVLVVCVVGDADASADVSQLVARVDRDGDGHRRLSPLGPAEVQAIVDLYAGDAAGEVSVESVLRASGGVPDRVHELMSEWAEREAARRLEAAAEYLSAERVERQAGLDFANNVIGLKLARLYTATPDARDLAPGTCPYKGLASFEDDDSRFFFGREQLVGELAARTVGAGMLAVIGASGSGKSSVLAAGLVPSLRAGLLPGSDRWRVASMRPGEHPAAELDEALAAERDGDERLVLVVDQFEELFAPAVSEAERSACVDALTSLAADAERHVVVIGMRADFYGHCAVYPELARLVAANQVLVGAMSAKELRRAIELPARRCGVRVDAALVDRLVEEVADQPGGLPLLSTALVELWDRRSSGWLRYADYEQAGGVSGAVARLAESSYEQLSERQREVARALFLRLVTAGEDGVVTRRIVHRDELGLEPGADITVVVTRLTADRLLTVTDDTVEVAHEALLREWPRLVEWLCEDAQGRELREHLMQAARRWQGAGRDASELYRGTRLTATLDWAAGRAAELNETEQDFLRESRTESERDAERQRRQNRRLRMLLVGVSVVTVLAVAAGIIALVQRSSAQHQATVALGRQLGAEAVSEPRVDRAMLLARQSMEFDRSSQTEGTMLATLLRSPDLISTLSLPLTVRPLDLAAAPDGHTIAVTGNDQTLRLYDVPSRRLLHINKDGALPPAYMPHTDQVFESTPGPGPLIRLDPATGRIVRRYAWGPAWDSSQYPQQYHPPVVTPDGKYVVLTWAPIQTGANGSVYGPGYIQRWPVDASHGPVRPTIVRIGEPGVIASRMTSSGRLVVASDGAISTWNPNTLREIRRYPAPALADVVDVPAAISPDGRVLAYGLTDGTVHFVNAVTGASRQGQGAHSGAVDNIAFSPDSRVAVSTGDDGLVIVWDPATGAVLQRLAGHGGHVTGVAFSPDGRTLYTTGLDGTVLRWALSGSARFGSPFRVSDPTPDGLPPISASTPPSAISPDGATLAVRSGTHGVALYSTSTLRRIGALDVGRSVVTALAWSGAQLVVGSARGAVTVWDVRAHHRTAVLRGLRFTVSSVAASPDGRELAAVDGTLDSNGIQDKQGDLVMWKNGHVVLTRTWHPAIGNAVQFSPDGSQLAVATDSSPVLDDRPSVLIYDVASGRLLHSMSPSTGTISVAFGHGGTIAAGSWQGIVTVYSAATGAQLGRPTLAMPAPVASLAFDPSGMRYATGGGGSGGARLWNAPTQQMVGTPFPGGEGAWGRVLFSPDSRWLFAVFSDGSAYRWPVTASAWMAHACAIAGRNLTKEEWHRYVGARGYQSTCPMYPPGP
ncbi:MAG TPA: hypothetical protein VFH74_00725 [Gaiellales bacterium]|nr:hypothetical protein [Gaiellales bacterium]